MAGERVSQAPPAAAGSRLAVSVRARENVWPLAAVGVVVLSVIVRILVARRMPTPWIMSDEITYSELAKSFSDKHRMLFHGHAFPFVSIYPIAIAPAWLAGAMSTTYTVAKTLNVLLMSLAAIPFWFWARRLMPAAYAFGALVLFLLLPAFVYTNELMTESLALPVALLAFFTMAVALERPTVLRQVLVLLAIGLAALVRLQFLVVFIGLPTAVVLKGLLDAQAAGARRPWRSIVAAVRGFAWALGVLFVGGILYLGLKAAQGASPTAVLGGYEKTGSGYSLNGVVRWFALHVAETPYAVGLVPVCAFIVVAGIAFARNARTTEAERAFLAVALGVMPWMILQVGAFASQFSARIEERNLIYLGPLFLLAFLLWMAQGLPRPPLLAALAALVPAVLLVALPLESLLNISIRSDTFSFSPLLRLSIQLDGGVTDVRIVLAIGALVAAISFLALPRRVAVPALLIGVGAFLALSSHSAFGAARGLAIGAKGAPEAADVSWIDHRLGADESVVFVADSPTTANPHLVWQTEFWNRSVHPVLELAPPPNILGDSAAISPTGRVTTTAANSASEAANARYAVAPKTLKLAGQVIAQTGQLALYRLNGPLRLASATTGIYSDRWTGATASFTSYGTANGKPAKVTLRFTVPKDLPAERVAVKVGSRTQNVSVASGATQVVRVSRRGPFRVDLNVTPTFQPAALGLGPDTRQLGVLATVETGSP